MVKKDQTLKYGLVWHKKQIKNGATFQMQGSFHSFWLIFSILFLENDGRDKSSSGVWNEKSKKKKKKKKEEKKESGVQYQL